MKNSKLQSLLLAAGLTLSLAGCNGKGETNEAQAAPDVAAVERRDLEIRAESSGQIEPVRVVEVKSKVSGELTRITVETGDEVEQGALIASVDPRDVRNSYAQASADMGLARARVETAQAQRRRAEKLAKEGILSTQDLENSRLEETNARAELLKARTNLELAQEKTGDVTIRAPISGTVIEKTVEQGQIIASASGNVSGGTTLIKMADLATVRARALVDEVDIGRIKPGQTAAVEVEAYPGRTFRGKVIKIEPQAVVEQNVTMFPVLVELPNPDRLLKPGMNSEVGIEVANRDGVVAVPNGAVASMRDAPAAGTALGLEEKDVRDQLAKLRNERQGRQGQSGGDGRTGGERPSRGTGDRTGDRGGERTGERGGERGGNRAMNAGGGDVRPGVVFVKGPNGPEPKTVLLGLSDWDYTEVVRGLEPGTQVYLISVARLQQQQQQSAERMRQRAGGGMLGGGSGGSGSSGGGQRSGGRGGN
ncbi:MAG TPA: efflux RND transporter periplasmic adaptor subunit [Thermoanaerobaculia bacterium]|nr:efflux RND transporter periplasmic adaptor subunit [Thermoanaerobaculia bacterium]